MAIVYPEHQRAGLKPAVTVSISTASDGLGDVCDTKGLSLLAVAMSSVWTSATMTFKAGTSTSNMASLFNTTGAEFTLTCTSSQVHYVDPSVFAGFRYIQPRSGTAGSVVAQTTATSVQFILGHILEKS